MPIGIEVRNGSGSIVLDPSSNPARTIGSYYIVANTSGSFYDARITSGRFFYTMIRLNENNITTDFTLNVPFISYDGAGTVYWAYGGVYGGVAQSIILIYGVY